VVNVQAAAINAASLALITVSPQCRFTLGLPITLNIRTGPELNIYPVEVLYTTRLAIALIAESYIG
jgi:hypothetical protein